MNDETLQKRYHSILHDCEYLSLATENKTQPWVAPLYFAHDKKGVLYFISRKDSLHALHIKENPNVAVSIFDSSAAPGQCDGLQIRATCQQMIKGPDILHAGTVLFTRRFQNSKERALLLNPALYSGITELRLFAIQPIEIYIVDKTRPNDHRAHVLLS